MTAYATAFSEQYSSNWDLCVQNKIWGSPSATASHLSAGDRVFIWLPKRGWVGACQLTQVPVHSSQQPGPWPNFREYQYTARMDVLKQLRGGDGKCPNGREPLTGLHSVQLRNLNELSARQAQSLQRHFGI